MSVVRKVTSEVFPNPFGDLAVLQRKWHAAVRPGMTLPPYEDIMLGSLGRMADHFILLQTEDDKRFTVSRIGRYVQDWLGEDRWNVSLDDLPQDCSTALAESSTNALRNNRPHLSAAHCVRGGDVHIYNVLALPSRSRWGGNLVGIYVSERGPRYNLVDAIFSATDAGLVSLAALRDAQGVPFDLQVVHFNAGATELLNASATDFQWRRLSEGGHALSDPSVLAWILSATEIGKLDQLQIQHGARSLSLSATAMGDLVSLTISDITEIKRREESFRLLFDGNPMPMWVFDQATFRFLNVNDAAVRHYGYSRETFLNMTLNQIWPADERDLHARALARLQDSYESNGQWRHLKADGTAIHVLTYGRRIAFDGHDAYLVSVVDITERRKAEARIAHMAHHDGLTELPNRLFFQKRLNQALDTVGPNHRVAVLCIDLDMFKSVNDSFGHPIGDILLKQVAKRMQDEMQGAELAARLGGDEFAIILVGDLTPGQVSDRAARLTTVLCEPYRLNSIEAVIGASIGIAMSPGDGMTGEDLMRHGDMALYRAKADGGGVHRFFEAGMDREAQRRLAMERDLRVAHANGQFELYYQPLVDAASQSILGCEALIRWQHPTKGMISPADFIPVAEQIGLIVPIGEWVLRTACKEATRWPKGTKVAVNLSAVQFRSRNLVQTIISALDNAGLSPRRLELEITEGLLLAETELNLGILHQLRALGVRISMDDFGTGYSSLSYLRSFPFDKIKIDRSFVKDLGSSADCVAIVRAISGIGRSLNITTTAEGVETADQLEWLRAEGCDEVQGYLFSPARPAHEIMQMLVDSHEQAIEVA